MWTTRLVLLLAFLSLSLGDILPYFDDDFDHEVGLLMKEGYKLFLEFYSPNDLNSQNFLPTYMKIDEVLDGGEQGIIIGRTELIKNQDLQRRFGVTKMYGPTFVYIVEGKFYRYRGMERVEEMVEYMKTGYLNDEPQEIPLFKWTLEELARQEEEARNPRPKNKVLETLKLYAKKAVDRVSDLLGEPQVALMEKTAMKRMRGVLVFAALIVVLVRRVVFGRKTTEEDAKGKSD